MINWNTQEIVAYYNDYNYNKIYHKLGKIGLELISFLKIRDLRLASWLELSMKGLS